jgi:hypothetical protein
MSFSIEKNPTQFFAVVGAAYIPEHHLDARSHYVPSPDSHEGGLWTAIADFAAKLAGSKSVSRGTGKSVQCL